ncbi:MAG: GNAT family N-acetyltransferase [Pseudomonadota bacterium]
MMEVRPARPTDIPNILSLIRQKARFDGCLESLRTKATDIEAAFFSDTPKAKALLAVKGDQVFGIATYYDIYSTFIAKPGIWLDDLFVDQNRRKTGAGIALMKRLCEIAVATGCGRIDWIVATDNRRGRDFYESIGATIFETVRHSRLDETAIHQLARS